MMPSTRFEQLDCAKLRHDFANDIGSLKLNVETLRIMRENPEDFAELIDIMLGTIRTLEQRINTTILQIAEGQSDK